MAEGCDLGEKVLFVMTVRQHYYSPKSRNSTARSYLTLNKVSNLDNEIFHCIYQLKFWKKGNNIDNV